MSRRWLLGWMTVIVAAMGIFQSACALQPAENVSADEITGVVLEAATGKPVPGAVVAIRFERNNTGHGGPHCFRSMAVETNSDGRFKFAPWTQQGTLANYAQGVVKAYKIGYAIPLSTFVKQSNRDVLGIAFSDTIKIPKTELRIELEPFNGSAEDRKERIHSLVGEYNCRSRAKFDSAVLFTRIREEIRSSSLADLKLRHSEATFLQWIDDVIGNN